MKLRLKQLLARAKTFRSDGSVGSVERFAGVRDRFALWCRAARLTRGKTSQEQIDLAMARCRRLAALRAYRAERGLKG